MLAGKPESGAVDDSEEESRQFGPYTTIRTLGEGGMGIVYLARQEEPIHRTVALKVVKPGMDSSEVIARFESERQALALMEHPNIAQVFDAGTAADGRPYFVMEYVHGVPLLEYCDANRLTNRERLELFRAVCLAIHHAHQKGVIHRDLKPSNVLVEVRDDRTIPKVIDFGVAKATRQRLTERTMYTEAGVLLGTPEYMSPEQASLEEHHVDAASDIYSLGVVLYELIAGVLPFDARTLRRAGYFALQRAICEQEPPAPGVRLRGLGASAEEEIARHRRTDARALERQLRGDLEWITLRALEKERERRYASASEFASDIARYLRDEPVLAGPPTHAYRLRKFVRKHRIGVSAAAAIVICLLAGTATSTALYFRARQQRDIAERQSYEANLANADALIESGDVEAARERLFQCPQRLRNWPWRLLYAMSDTSAATLRGTGDPVPDDEAGGVTFAFSPDGKRMYYRMRRTVHAWEVPYWKPAADYGVFGPILGMSRDGSRIVARSLRKKDPELFVLNTLTGKRMARLIHADALAAAFSPAGDLVATGSGNSGIRLWDANSGRLRGSASPGTEFSAWPRIVFSPDGRYIAFAGGSPLLHFFETRHCNLVRSFKCQGRIFTTAFSPDGRHVATADGTATIRIWNVATGRQEIAWPEVNAVNIAAYNPVGTELVTGTQTGVVRVWDASTGSAIATLTGPTAELRAITFTPDRKWILTGSNEGEVWVWDARTYGSQVLSRAAAWMAMSRNGARLLVTNHNDVAVVDSATGGTIPTALPRGFPLALSPGGERVAVGDSRGYVRVIELLRGTVVLSWAAHRSHISSLVFSPDGRYLASGSWDKTAHIWDAASGSEQALLRLDAEVNDMAFSPDGKSLAIGTAAILGGGLSQWEAPSGRLIRRFAPPSGVVELVTAVAFSPGGESLASGDYYSRRIRIEDLRTGRRIELAGHAAAPITALAYSPDGRLLASGAYDNTVRLWDTSRNELIFTLRRPSEPVGCIAFSPTADKLFASYYHGGLRIWNTSTTYSPNIRERVAQFERQSPVMADVWRRIEDDPTLDKAQRRTAQLLYAWRVDFDRTLRSDLWSPAVYPPKSIAEFKLLLRRAEDTYAALPLSVEAWTILGAAQYRNGLYAQAERTLARASSVASEDPRAEAFLAMTLYRLGQAGKARDALARARLLLREADPIPRQDGEALIAETEALVAGGNRQRPDY